MSDLSRRLDRLQANRPAEPCPECGLVPGAPVEFVPDWSDVPEIPDADLPEPGCQYCAGCGRILFIDWPDARRPPERSAEGGGHGIAE